MAETTHYDAVIVGGGPAGLSAALILGRCRRRVMVCDAGRQRNRRSLHMHAYLTRDGIAPAEFLQLARRDLQPYDVKICDNIVQAVRRDNDRFLVDLDSGLTITGRKILLATGVRDRLPRFPGVDELYGISVHHCPYCDGWENRDRAVAVYSQGGRGFGLAISLKTWTDDVVLLTDGPARFSIRERQQMEHAGVVMRRERIAGVDGVDGRLRQIRFVSGAPLARHALFFSTKQDQSCELARGMGCEFTKKGAVQTSLLQETCVPGVYVAGDASRDVQLVIVAAAEGAKAGFAINTALQQREKGPRANPDRREKVPASEAAPTADGPPE